MSTDDPKMFGNSLAGEYEALERVHLFTHDEIRTLILNAVCASWLPDDRKRALEADLRSSPGWNG